MRNLALPAVPAPNREFAPSWQIDAQANRDLIPMPLYCSSAHWSNNARELIAFDAKRMPLFWTRWGVIRKVRTDLAKDHAMTKACRAGSVA